MVQDRCMRLRRIIKKRKPSTGLLARSFADRAIYKGFLQSSNTWSGRKEAYTSLLKRSKHAIESTDAQINGRDSPALRSRDRAIDCGNYDARFRSHGRITRFPEHCEGHQNDLRILGRGKLIHKTGPCLIDQLKNVTIITFIGPTQQIPDPARG